MGAVCCAAQVMVPFCGLHEEVMLTPDEVVAGRAPVHDAPAVQPTGMACLNDPNVLGALALHYVTVAQMEMLERKGT